MIPVTIRAVSCAAPGLPDWETARAVLAGKADYDPVALGKLKPVWLPANERRRLSATMRLALYVGEQAIEAAGCAKEQPASVFTSANGDGDIIGAICEELAHDNPALSPTKFHNSVHNAPAGYWAIAAGSRQPSTALGAHDSGFAAGWIEAALMAEDSGGPVLLIAYDRPFPAPLDVKRPVSAAFACALLLDAAPDANGIATVDTTLSDDTLETRLDDPALEALRLGNPAARVLPLLKLLATGEVGSIALPATTPSPLTLHINPSPGFAVARGRASTSEIGPGTVGADLSATRRHQAQPHTNVASQGPHTHQRPTIGL